MTILSRCLETQDRLDSPNFDPYSQMPVSQNTQDIRDQTGISADGLQREVC